MPHKQSRESNGRILLVEDNPGDVRLMQEALRERNGPLSIVRDGEEALAFLGRTGRFQDAPRPDLIFLDLNLPGKDGREVLATIKSNAVLRQIPVVVLTTSESDEDVQHCYDLHANCFLQKPADLDEFLELVRQTEAFWLRTVKLPKH
jgi:CheY-like chemotaxis protein